MESQPRDRALTNILRLGFVVVILFAVSIYWKGRPLQKQIREEQRANDALVSTVLASAPVTGNESANVLLIEFGDFQCPYCKQTSSVVTQALAKRPLQVRRAWIHAYNAELHPEAESAAIASQCAHQQGAFWPFHDLLFAQQDNLSPLLYNQIAQELKLDMTAFHSCSADTATRDLVRAHNQFAGRQGVSEVPYLLINEQPLQGEISLQALDELLNAQLSS